jgi:hypothetical protein
VDRETGDVWAAAAYDLHVERAPSAVDAAGGAHGWRHTLRPPVFAVLNDPKEGFALGAVIRPA